MLHAIGFPVVIILFWIYDLHPEEGMVRTKPAAGESLSEAYEIDSTFTFAAFYLAFSYSFNNDI